MILRPTKTGSSSNSRKHVAIVVAAPPAIAAWTLIIGKSSSHFKLFSAVACEGKGLCTPHMVALWGEQDVAAWRYVCVVQRGQLCQKVVWGQLHYSWSKINLKKKRMLKPRSIIFKFSTHNKQQLKAKKKKQTNQQQPLPPPPPQAKQGRQNKPIPFVQHGMAATSTHAGQVFGQNTFCNPNMCRI